MNGVGPAADALCGPLVPDWLSRQADGAPERLALVASDGRRTFADLDRDADRLAQRLAGVGVRDGHRVATLQGNGGDAVALLHALTRLAAVLVPCNTRLAAAEVAWQARRSRADVLIADAEHLGVAREVVREIPGLRLVGVGTPADPHALPLDALPPLDVPLRRQIDLAALHSIVFTSGTTGRPKGARLTYGNHWWNAVGSALNLGLFPDDRLLTSLPLYHVGGMALLWRSVIYGVPAVVQERFDPAAMNRAVDDGATIVSVVAAMLQRMLDDRGPAPYPPSLRCVLLGGGPAPPPLLEACAARGVPVVQTYGLTESGSQAVTLAPRDALRKLGSAGKPLSPVDLRIDRDGREAAAGETGEILLRGPSISPGYDGEVDERVDGWLRTGDLGWRDAEGYLYVADRRDDLIISGGENVYPAEVEAVLLAHPAVAEAGVTGRADARWGRVPVAAVVLRPGAQVDAEDLRAFCAARLARYKVPAAIRFRGELPRTASGKVLRRALADDPSTSAPGG